MNLEEFGWSSFFELHFEQYYEIGYFPGRISREHKHVYNVLCEYGELIAEISGKMRFDAQTKSDYPAIGDWVALQPLQGERRAIIQAILPRTTCFGRKVKFVHTERQILAANIDTAFLVTALNGDFNLRRIERYLTLAWESKAQPVVILNKTDVCDDIEGKVIAVEAVALGVPIHPVSGLTHEGLESLKTYFEKGKTVTFLGSSGVGKSTLINSIIGEQRQKVKAVREYDGRGRHTTTHRELLLLPQGGVVIDTPGLREIQMWADEEQLQNAFDDIETLAGQCRFRDCQHRTEPDCAIREALDNGSLDRDRYNGYLKIQRELRFLEVKQSQKARLLEKAKWKRIAQFSRNYYKNR